MSNDQHRSSWIIRLPAITGIVAYGLFLRPQMLKWGTRLGESQRRLPGDELIPQPGMRFTHAINIDAPPEAVWPWLAQMGRERTGYYGLDLATNAGIPSVTFLRKDLPAPEVDMPLDGGCRILELEPNRKLLIGGFDLQCPPNSKLDITVLYLLERRRDGSTRLISRTRATLHGLTGFLLVRLFEPIYYGYARQQFGNLKKYATSMAHLKG